MICDRKHPGDGAEVAFGDISVVKVGPLIKGYEAKVFGNTSVN